MRRPWTSLRRFWNQPPRHRTLVRRRPTGQLLRLEQLETRLAPAVSLLNHFDGMNFFDGGGAVPPDTCGAVGPNSYIETVNSAVRIFNKSTNDVIASDDLSDFLFTRGGLTPVGVGRLADATMAYDEVTGQFIVGDLDVNSTDGSALDIAVSNNSNPTTLDGNSWNFYQIDMGEANTSGDYPGNMGYNADAFVFTFNMFGSNGVPNHVEVAALDQSSLAAGGNVSSLRFDVSGISMRPVTMHDSAAGDPMWFVSEGGFHNTIKLTRIDDILTSPTVYTFNIRVNSYNPANAPLNPDGSAITTNNDTRILKAAEANDEIVACQNVGVGSNEDDARWYEFDITNPNSPFLLQQGNVGFGANTYTVYPSIDINSNSDIAMGFSKSGNDTSTDFMSTFITGRKFADASGTMETPVEVTAGDANNTDGREGDFSGINVDPADGTFWVADEYSTFSLGTWDTSVAQFAMNAQSFFVIGGELEIFGEQLGANFNDSVTITLNGRGGVFADLNGERVGFDPGDITSIFIALGGGSNTIDLNATPLGVTTDIDGGGSDTVFVGNGTTQVIGGDVNIENPADFNNIIVNDSVDSSAHTITLRNIGTNTADSQGNSDPWGEISGLLGNGNINYEYADTRNVTVQTGNASGNVINVLATGGIGVTNIVATTGATINVGNGTLSGLQNTLNIESPPSLNNININDSADSTARTVIIQNIGANPNDSGGSGDTWGQVSFSGLVAINYEYADTRNVTVRTGKAFGNVINVLATGGIGVTNIVAGNGATVNVGNGGTLSGIGATLNLESPPSFNTINIDDSADATARTVAIRNIGANPNDSQGDSDPWGQVSGLGGFAINYEYADTNNVTVRTGTASGDVINVLATGGSGVTNIVTGNGATINVGNGTVAGITSTLNIESPPSSNTIVINDSADTHARTVTVRNIGTNPSDSEGNSGRWGQVSGLAPANIYFEIPDTSSVTVRGSNAASTYNILDSSVATAVTGGGGSDTFNVGSGNNLNSIGAALTVNGGGGSNTLNANDSSSATGQGYTLSSTQLTRGGIVALTYASMHQLNFTAGGSDTLTLVAPAPTALVTFHGGSGANTLVGANVTNTWTLNGANAGKVGNVTFDHFQNLTGGSSSDTFNFTTTTASVSGTLNGGAGSNQISYATLGSSFLVNVTLASNTSGTSPLLAHPFVNINSVAGSTDTANTLTAPNSTNTWTISGANAGNVNTGPATVFSFTGMPHLAGGSGIDTFKFSSTSGTVLSLKGGGATSGKGDWLNYAAFGSAATVNVNLGTGSATNVNGGAAGAVTGIQNVLGSATGTNNLTGSALGNILIGGSGLNTMVGGSGNSLLIGGSGHGSITGGSGTDILIAGTTTFTAGTTAGQNSLMAILAELRSSDTFADKVYDLIHGTNSGDPAPHGHDLNGSNKLTWNGTVHASSGAFTLKGDTAASPNPDWFFSTSTSTVVDFNDDGVNDEHNNNAISVF